jgi:ABC-type lipoprotein export system ATPase subunit
MCDFLQSLKRRTTIVFATHHPAVRQIADRHLHVANGVISEITSGSETAADSQSAAVEARAP